MRTVNIARGEFIATLERNREQHRQVFERALEGYHARIVRELERRLHDLRRGRHVDVRISLPEPEDHTDDYDRVLTMARMSVDEVIELDADDFAMYVMDQWRWKQTFTTTTGRYL